jgi:molybdopterin synthase catalytic subunit
MTDLFQIRETPLSIDECFAAVQHSSAGGVVVFVGVVRDHNAGRSVTLLEYQAYSSMAERELRSLAEEIRAELPGVRLACLHRVGALSVGDLAVVCAASAPHRQQAFTACQALIDRLKQRVPVWKREHDAEGPHWVGFVDVRLS